MKLRKLHRVFGLSPSFQYEPLDASKREIRLLKLAAGVREDPIIVKLVTVSLDDDPVFDALSYLWGEQEPVSSIYIGRRLREFRVARNLRNALLDLRDKSELRTLWVDAVCINQSNNEERGHQVRSMRQVYSSARAVRAWIDVEVDLDAEPFQRLLQLAKGEIALKDYDAEFWFPVANIFRSSYWNRVWIQQELILARHITIHCRDSIVNQEEILNFQYTFERLKFHHWRACPGCLTTLFLALSCAEPRDHVYGLLGIMADIEVGECVVDYNLPLTEIYAQLMALFMKKYNSLTFLCHLPQHRDTPNVQSWLPSPEKRSWLWGWDLERSSASGEIAAARAHIHSSGLALSTPGLLIDRVLLVGQREPVTRAPVSTWMDEFEQMYFHLWPLEQGHPPWLKDEILQLFLSSWKDDAHQQLLGRGKFDEDERQSVMNSFLEWRKVPGISSLNLYEIAQGESVNSEAQSAALMIANTLWGMMFIGTQAKRMGVIVHNSAVQPGDEVWILFGCPMPIVLRPRPDDHHSYTWIGHATIPGLMHGEACEGISDTGEPGPDYRGPPIQEITLW
ncbi:hypothetical protein NA57DRAFT_60588 [Rhizodiscina lignyota]|uniref:Heterokaryon incompatibility domain-containing protein n=1 Tax=Rhizodiscina lignyota TaxID=1504668 RepID=A0A9P4I8C9_9PEZI|nr:hypothetical protein NA57DRAFT_60588 [Rhizodiscina lignyota]